MKIDAFGQYDILGGKRDLEQSFKSDSITIFYTIEHEDGIFKSNDRCLFQCQLTPNGRLYTGIAHNWGVFTKKSELSFRAPIFSDFKACFNKNLPEEVIKKFPHLECLMIHSKFGSNNDMIYEYDSIRDYGLHVNFDSDIPWFSTWPIDIIKGNRLSLKIITAIHDIVQFFDDSINEYNHYKKTRLYKLIEPNIGNIKNKLETGTSIYMIYRFAKLALSLYTGASNGDGEADIDVDFDSSSFDNLSSQDMADYLCETDIDVNDNNSDVSFTGSGDKYTDNDYNQRSADDLLKKEAYYREKGDNSAADAAHRQAMDHLRRVK